VVINALKVQTPTLGEIARFKYEFDQINKIEQQDIVQHLELIEHKGAFSLVLEDFDSISIRSLIINNHEISVKWFLSILSKTAIALGNLHKQNITHRNITPDSILINRENNTLKLTAI